MRVREGAFALALVISGALIIYGVSSYSRPAGFIIAGVLLAAWVWLVIAE